MRTRGSSNPQAARGAVAIRRAAPGLALAMAACWLWAPAPAAQTSFVEATFGAGLTYTHHAAKSRPDCIFEFTCEPDRMTGGAAVADIDGDGDLDLFVTVLDGPDILYRNLGTGHFEDATAASGLDAFDLQSNGAAFGDVDNDGDPDLFVTVLGDEGDPVNNRHYLFINDGTGVFTEEALPRGAAGPLEGIHRGWSVAFGDFDRDGFLDIHTTEWFPERVSHGRLLRNLGSAAPGHFEDVTDAAGVTADHVHGFASTFTDLDGDGWPEMAIAADFGTSRLFWNNGDGTFTDGTIASGAGTDENGMGSTFGDFDGDGDLDWFVTSIFDPDATCDRFACGWGYTGNRLYRNEGGRLFSDATDEAGVRDGYWGWGTAFFDHDNDGDLDLVMTNGVDFPDTPVDDAYNRDPMRFWVNRGDGVMTEVSAPAGLTDDGSGKGLLVFDYDDDGDQDLFIVNNAATPRLYRNEMGNANGWLRVRTRGTTSNRDGIGAWVRVQRERLGSIQVREIGTGSHFLGQSERTAHFGLGAGEGPVALVRIDWPSGIQQAFSGVARNTTLTAVEPACTDGDGDGYCGASDCNDEDPSIHAAALELPGNRVDENCDGSLAPCDPGGTWQTHGAFIRCVQQDCERLIEAGFATRQRCAGLVRGAARSPAGSGAPARPAPRGN